MLLLAGDLADELLLSALNLLVNLDQVAHWLEAVKEAEGAAGLSEPSLLRGDGPCEKSD